MRPNGLAVWTSVVGARAWSKFAPVPPTTGLVAFPQPLSVRTALLLTRLRRLTGASLLATAALAAGGASVAQAGTYDVVSCKTASGTPTSTAGWSSSSTLLYDVPGNDCALGGRLTAKFTAAGGAVSGGLWSAWQFTAPEGTSVKSVSLDHASVARAAKGDEHAVARSTVFRGPLTAELADRLETTDAAVDGTDPSTPGGEATFKVDGPTFGIAAGCAGEAGTSICRKGDGSRARIAVDSARITLEDATPPVAKVSGKILGGKPVRGESSIQLEASDAASGVWQAEVRLGAAIVMPRRTVATNGGRCEQLPGTKAFAHPEPCDKSVKSTLNFNAKKAQDGSQLLTVTVWDAANNPIVAISEPVSVDNAKRIQADGTIMMPAIGSSLDAQLYGGSGGGKGSGDGLRPLSEGGDPLLSRIVAAMNTLADARIPYCYGGGHGTTPAVPSAGQYCWLGSPAKKYTGSGAVGLDCSSSLSWVLQQAGWDIQTMTSGSFAALGEPGEGEKMTIWANGGHVYAEVKIDGKSYFWGTASSNPEHGPGWHPSRSSASFTARHLPGL